MRRPRKDGWKDAEDEILIEWYPKLGRKGVVAAGLLQNRTENAIRIRVQALNLRFDGAHGGPPENAEVAWPVPRMDAHESDACQLLTAWRGPVSPNLGLRP